jgi:hypothetical protein
MTYRDVERRLADLERQIELAPGDSVFRADIGSNDGRYWIDGVEVDQAEFMRRAPADGPFFVDIGDNDIVAGGAA